jgi:hypothetical protein
VTVYPVTLNVPEAAYEKIQRAAEKVQRPVDELLVEAIVAVAPTIESASADLNAALAQMAYLNDAALWQAARSTMAPEQRERLATLHDIQQRRPLSTAEQAENQALLRLYREALLVRAQAAVLLKQRGYDVGDLTQFEPLG